MVRELGICRVFLLNLNKYIAKYGVREALISSEPQSDLEIVVVIPAHNESEINITLSALYSCERPIGSVEIILVVNASETAQEDVLHQNLETFAICQAWAKQQTDPKFQVYSILENELPKKHAGVGLARKIGMDEAVRRFEMVGNDQGVIACFDADSTCEPTYLKALESHFSKYPKTPGCSIKYAHPLFGTQFEAHTYLGIAYYELHLRYYNQALRACGYPNAYHTVGSSMAVRSSAYQKQGGMNKRQAGEDFYFLHKIIALGDFTELNETCVIPSPRSSDRVPFGTGRAIGDFLKAPSKGYYTYNIEAFKYLAIFFKNVPEYYLTNTHLVQQGGVLPYVMIDFLSAYFFDERVDEIRKNSSNINSFTKRFYNWFNAFMILKFVHFVRDNAHPNVRVERAALDLLKATGYKRVGEINSLNQLLEVYRALDESQQWRGFVKDTKLV